MKVADLQIRNNVLPIKPQNISEVQKNIQKDVSKNEVMKTSFAGTG